jgi:hypothetical protein
MNFSRADEHEGGLTNMRRFEELKRLDTRTRNKLRAILSDGEVDAIGRLTKLRGKLTPSQSETLDAILNSPFLGKAVRTSTPFPKKPPFKDTLQIHNEVDLPQILALIEANIITHRERLHDVASSLHQIDTKYTERDTRNCIELIIDAIEKNGWSHAILRRIVLIRENLPEGEADEKIEKLMRSADLKAIAVASLVHSYSLDKSILTAKRSILNLADRGAINRYSRTISRLSVQPFSRTPSELAAFLAEVEKCSLIDAVILAKFNSHLFPIAEYPGLREISERLGERSLFERLVATYDPEDSESEYAFFKQSSAWLEYEPVRQYRILIDHYYDASNEEIEQLHVELASTLDAWVGDAALEDLVNGKPFTKHAYASLSKLELSGRATRSAIFNFWLHSSEGQIGFQKDDLLTLMGLTRDLARTIPIKAARTAAKLAKDELVKLILFLLLGKRSKNELDSFQLRKLLEEIAEKRHGGSLVSLVKSYEITHPYVSEYIYDIATEDFLAKLSKLAPHRADIPEIRASLHEWMAGFTKDDHFLQRARTVRIDHQLNRVRNEIDDNRIYVDPSRFASWIEDEMMIDLNSALTSSGAGKKGVVVNCDETILSLIVKQCYSAFCSNAVFGIASYIGRRIRHGTFHGHLYSSVINDIEKNEKFRPLFDTPAFSAKWSSWKDTYNKAVEAIIKDRLHVYSKAKPLGLLQPENYTPGKLEILAAAVKNISTNYAETTSVSDIDQIIIDYCWRLAEIDLVAVTKYLRAQQGPLKNLVFLEEQVVRAASPADTKLADLFYRELELSIDRKLTNMFGWFKRPSIVAPKAFMSLLFDATVAEVRDTIPSFNPQSDDSSEGEIELVGDVYHLVYDSLAVVVANAAKHGDRSCPVRRRFEVIPGKVKRLIVEISSSIRPSENPGDVSAIIEQRKSAKFDDANLYQGKSGISKLMLLQNARNDFAVEQYEVVGNEVKVRLAYALEH